MRVAQVKLSRYTTLGVGGPAELWTVESRQDLSEATQEPYRILGNGSNLLISDAGVPERVIRLSGEFTSVDLAGWVGGGALLPGVVQAAVRANLTGLEVLFGIPASIGGAVRMNAGTRYGEIASALAEVEIFYQGNFHCLSPLQLGLSYRKSSFPKEAIVTRVRFHCPPADSELIGERLRAVQEARAGQPKRKSAGCAFKNPAGDSAGRLIDQAGLKGLRQGQAMVSHEHGNFIVNLGGAKANEVATLIELVRARLPLELEWEIWGDINQGELV